MSHELVIKEVNFNGDSLLAVKNIDENKIYVAVSFVCNGIGLTENQRDRQVKNIKQDIVLQNSIKNLPVKYDGQIRNVICIELDYLPLWLAKISITPSMQENNPDVVNKLIEYQLKVKDILTKEFIVKEKFEIPQTYSEALKLAANFQKQLEEQKPKIELYDQTMSSEGLLNFIQVANTFNECGRNILMEKLRNNHILLNTNANWNMPNSKYAKHFKVIVRPRKTKDGLQEISTTLCKPSALKLIKKVLDKEKDLQSV
jgi:phage antirepressor YoqD-like protein